MSGAPRVLAFIGDVHLSEGDPALGAFLGLLDRLGERASRLVLMGDLFDVWIGRPELEGPHHRAVVAELARLRSRGLVVRYLEGNRDYRIAEAHAGRAFDDVGDGGIEERFGGRRLHAVHGDLVNVADRRYRRWRRLSRSRPVWALFQALPRRTRVRLAARLERSLRGTNLAHKVVFPEAAVREFARPLVGAGYDAVVLGHFHVEKQLDLVPGRVYVLPEWKGSRRHLEVDAAGGIAFVDSSG